MTTQNEISLQASPFADDFVDVPGLNARISMYLLDRIENVRRAGLTGKTVASKAIAILGPAGGGKTHLFSRLTHHSGGRPTLVLLRPYFGVSVSLRDVLAVIVDQLCLPVRGEDRTQLDVITSHWLAPPDDAPTTPSLETQAHRDPSARSAPLERALGAIVSSLPEITPATHLARAVLELREREPSAAWGELAWLSGREPRASAGATSATALSEGDVLQMLRILAVLAAPVAPIVLTFDQLENLAGDDDARVLGYGNLVSEMVDSLPCFTIVQLALTSEWMQFIEPRLSLPQKTRIAREPLVLEAPDRDERELLLRAWHEQLMARSAPGGKSRFPRPLSDEELNQLLVAPGITPRLLLAALSRVLAGQTMTPAPPSSPYPQTRAAGANDGVADSMWGAEHERVRVHMDEKERSNMPLDAAELAEALTSALTFVPHLEVTTRTERDRVLTSVKAPGHELAILYLTSLHHGSVASTLARAIELAQSTKVVIVREKRFEFPRTWGTVYERRSAFERLPNARWLWLERDDLVRCLSVARLLSKARAKRLQLPGSDESVSPGELRETLRRAQAPSEWPGVASIARWLSDVPRETAAPSAVRESARSDPRPPQGPPSFPTPTLRAWLSLGREMGRSAVSRYAEKVRALVARSED